MVQLQDSNKAEKDDIVQFQKLKAREADDAAIKNSIYIFTRMLNAHYGKPVILLIDEYDVPLAKANKFGYYAKMLDVIRAMLGKALKTNEYLKFAVVTGCLKISKESIFTGTNNFVCDTVMGARFDEYIGFTQSDVKKLLDDTGFAEHAEEMKFWYDGYRFGSINNSVAVYCPWDVLSYVSALQINASAVPQSYWENTSHNDIIRSFIERKDLWKEDLINEDFEVLMNGGYIVKTITENLTYDIVYSSANNLWSLLYMTGYLTQVPEAEDVDFMSGKLALRIPNEEIRRLFKTTVMDWFEEKVRMTDRSDLFEALWGQKEQECSKILSHMIFETISYHDYKEDFYHAFMVGILSFAGYKVKSNREQGEGRSDILLLDEQEGKAIVIELKAAESMKSMEQMCEKALVQIHEMRYAEALEEEYDEILCYGISFFKKRCKAKSTKYR